LAGGKRLPDPGQVELRQWHRGAGEI